MEATFSSETSVYNKPTRSHMPEDGIIKTYFYPPLISRRSKLLNVDYVTEGTQTGPHEISVEAEVNYTEICSEIH
jgi:hypothetical protein